LGEGKSETMMLTGETKNAIIVAVIPHEISWKSFGVTVAREPAQGARWATVEAILI
jgi:hypothetical protein